MSHPALDPQRPAPEITIADDFGRAIFDTIRTLGIRSVIEIGAWDGLGSTSILVRALINAEGRKLTCVEANGQRFAKLKEVTSGFDWIDAVCSRSVSRDAMTAKAFDDVASSPHNHLRYPHELVRQWWDAQCDGPGYLDSLGEETWDAALIDGCEFCGWDDYRLLKPRVRVLMLDDVFHAYKCSQAHYDLGRDPMWGCIWSSAFVRNGASIWVRR